MHAAPAGPVVRLDHFSVLDGVTVTDLIPGGDANVVRALDGRVLNCVIRDHAGRPMLVLYSAFLERRTLVINASLASVDASGATLFLHECITDLALPQPLGSAQFAASSTSSDFGSWPKLLEREGLRRELHGTDQPARRLLVLRLRAEGACAPKWLAVRGIADAQDAVPELRRQHGPD